MTKPNYTQLSNDFIDGRMASLSGAAVKTFLVITRRTIGWHKDTDAVSYSQIKALTGFGSRTTISRALDELIAAELIVATKTTGGTTVYELAMTSPESGLVTSPESVPGESTNRTGTSPESGLTKESLKETSKETKTTAPEEPAQTTLLPTSQPKKGKGDPRVPELITYYHDLYVQHAGCKPPVSGAWGKNFKHLLKTYDLDQLKHIIEYFFAYDGRTQYGFFTFVGKVGDLAPNALKTMPREDRSVTQLHRGDEGYVEFTLEDFHRYRKERQG